MADANTLPDLQDDLELLRNAAVMGGIIALGFFRRDMKVWTKTNSSPVTEADYAVDQHLATVVAEHRPHYGWLSEETVDNPERMSRKRVVIVDPIDGTRGFLRGEDSWTISIAIVEDGKPVVAVLYAPARDEMYEAVIGQGALCNRAPIVRRERLGDGGDIVSAPNAVHTMLEDAGLSYMRGPVMPSLAYRMVQVATGRLDVGIARRGAQDWDIAAADLILSECGIELNDVCVGRPTYNKADVRHGALATVFANPIEDDIHRSLIEIYGCPTEKENEL